MIERTTDLYEGGIMSPQERNLTTMVSEPGYPVSKIWCKRLWDALKRLDPVTAKATANCFCSGAQRANFIAAYLIAIQPFLAEDDRLKSANGNDKQ